MRSILNIKVRRTVKDVKQVEVAKHLGVSQQHYQMIEAGKTIPSDARGKQLEEYFGRSINFLLQIAE